MNFLLILLTISSFLVLFLTIEAVKKNLHIKGEISRKIMHLTAGILAIFWSSYLNQTEFISLTLFFTVVFIILRKVPLLTSIRLDHRLTYGEITYPLGLLTLSLFLYHEKHLFISGMLLLMIPDAIAGLYSYFDQKKNKTVWHFLIHFFTTLLLFSLFLPVHFFPVIALLISITEFVSPYGLDNFTVPLIFSLILTLIQFSS